MPNKANQEFIVNAGGSFSYVARIRSIDGEDITQASISSITRTITDTVTRAVTTASLTVSSVVFDTPQSDADVWDEDWNFKDDLPASAVPNRYKYLLQYTFTPTSGEVFKTREVDIHGD